MKHRHNLPGIDGPGVYLLLSGGEVSYVGRSRRMSARIAEHVERGRRFDAAFGIPAEEEELGRLEAALLRALRPAENRVGERDGAAVEIGKGADALRPRQATTPDRSRFLNEIEAAELLGISERTLQRYRVEGGGPPFTRIGARRIAYPEAGIVEWAAARTFPHKAAEIAAKVAA